MMKGIVPPQAVLFATILLSGALCARAPAEEPALPERVEFNRDIRPILSDNCFQCHGHDKQVRQADLRLDIEEGALADLGGRAAIVRGDPQQSELFVRIKSDGEDERMPPPSTGRRLTSRQIALIERWILDQAPWQKHWSFLPPSRSPLPAVAHDGWARNAVDTFILARLEHEGLSPSPEADPVTLLRRVSFDLTGLPPSVAEVESLLGDGTIDAYERAVDRLLASPRFGERMATRWLDGARYADTNGYQSDGERFMWRWRDWVINAYNRNMPFDQFTVEQLAGDMLSDASLDQKIASGFNRNHRGNAEGGIIPEEYAVEYVVDRVETTFTVWLGLTMGCGRCHEHKFDPISQNEFYRVYAYFNNVPEFGRAIKYGNSPPFIPAPTDQQRAQLIELESRLAAALAELERLGPELSQAQSEWEVNALASDVADGSIARGLVRHFSFDAASGAPPAAQGTLPDEARFEEGQPAWGAGRVGAAAEFDGRRYVSAGDVAEFGFYDKFSLAAWVRPAAEKGGGMVVARGTDAEQPDGYSLSIVEGRVQFNLVKRWLDDALRVETFETLQPDRWHHILATYDGTRLASGVRVYIDGRPQKLVVLVDLLNQTFATKEPLRIGGGGGPEGRFRGLIDEVRVYSRPLDDEEARITGTAESVPAILAIAPERRTSDQALKVRTLFLEQYAPEPLKQARAAVVSLAAERERLRESFPTTMVMEELPTPRETRVLLRGAYDRPGEVVAPGVPTCLPPLAHGLPNNRLGFARWVADPAHPLTARVAVNRLWQMLFGAGLVKTVDDFGAQGEWPTHPELLDWLAVEFSTGDRSGGSPNAWDVKALLRLLVTSSTYRQSSVMTPVLAQRDPENRLLARGPRLRLPAEMVRDSALSAAGLLVERLGGPSVKPYQPEGLWKELADTDYVQDHGENLYRRSLYTYFKRTVAPPAMVTFDAAGRETCIVRETRTNTPLQALTLMNDVTFVEAARALAQRVMREAGQTPDERLTLAFRLATARSPRPEELAVLAAGLADNSERFARDHEAAVSLLRVGESPIDERLNQEELAAYTVLAGLILNLDEVITKE